VRKSRGWARQCPYPTKPHKLLIALPSPRSLTNNHQALGESKQERYDHRPHTKWVFYECCTAICPRNILALVLIPPTLLRRDNYIMSSSNKERRCFRGCNNQASLARWNLLHLL